ncbi:helix-turn-helix domain-containing protein [Ohtaekwangia kribbensis]|uniref:Helix-turn-helix domain-containing protein n=1 Tax=Ohtaekwangia kribbensis TaxID=688913 RepID=A0ABW3K7T4_9BACT
MTSKSRTIHQGRNLKRFREMLGLKQEALADKLGEDWSQKKISMLENKDVIDSDQLEALAKALNVPAEAIKNFDEEKAIYNIQNNYEGSNTSNAPYYQHNEQCTFNPLDKYIEAVEVIKKQSEKIEKLTEDLLKEKDEKIALLQRMLDAGK